MSKSVGKIFLGFIASQIIVLVISLAFFQEISLLNYINFSFYLASFLLFTSLLVFTVNSGFFDTISYSFRTVFSGKDEEGKKKAFDEVTPLSELITFNTHPILIVGLLDFIAMLAGLYYYYL